jgi:Flp pilus assembly protein TadB
MEDFDNIRNLWRSQPLPPADLSAAFRRYGRRANLLTGAKVLVLGTILFLLVSLLRHNPLAVFGASLAVFGGVFFLVHDWSLQRAIARLNFAEPSTAFLRQAIARIEGQRNPLQSREFYIAIGGFCAGLTILVAAAAPRLPLAWRAVLHAGVLALPVFVYRHGRNVRLARFEQECLPLLDRLHAIFATIE